MEIKYQQQQQDFLQFVVAAKVTANVFMLQFRALATPLASVLATADSAPHWLLGQISFSH